LTVYEQTVVPARVVAVALDGGVVKHGNLVVASHVATHGLRGGFLLVPAPPRVELAAVRSQVRVFVNAARPNANQTRAFGAHAENIPRFGAVRIRLLSRDGASERRRALLSDVERQKSRRSLFLLERLHHRARGVLQRAFCRFRVAHSHEP
jgi:hypothetical protein